VRSLARLVFAFSVLGLLGAPAGLVGAADDDVAAAPDEGRYAGMAPDEADYEALAPYGTWLDVADYGRVWRPTVPWGWRPYVDGRWVWTASGWMWMGAGPWAWTFHYGRWALLPYHGWIWVPGTVWGPAWVDWYHDAGFVGWAPLAPFATRVTLVDHFVFVRAHDFCAPRLRPLLWRHDRVPDHVRRRWHHRDFRPPSRDRIERVTRRPVTRIDGRPPGTVAPKGFHPAPRPARPTVTPHVGRPHRDQVAARRLTRPDLGETTAPIAPGSWRWRRPERQPAGPRGDPSQGRGTGAWHRPGRARFEPSRPAVGRPQRSRAVTGPVAHEGGPLLRPEQGGRIGPSGGGGGGAARGGGHATGHGLGSHAARAIR
jgi:hypothetical protein